MLRPERMSRVSVTGSRRVMDEAIEVVHELNLFDVTDYDGAWGGFEPGDPVEGADAASEKLVTVRALQSTLGVTEEDAGPTRIVTEDALAEDLEEVRTTVNELDDERDDVESDLRDVEERLAAAQPFVDLDIDLDLLSGYDNLAVSVGEGDAESVRRALSDADDVVHDEVYTGEEAVAAVAYPADASLDDVLVGADFTSVEVPDADGDPEEYVSQLRHREQQLESELQSVESELETLRTEYGGFLLAAEEKLAIEVEKREAPLSFATTANAFVAEGWLPTEQYVDLAEALSDAVGDHVEVEELERADYDRHGAPATQEQVEAPGGASEPSPATDGGPASGTSSEPRSDGGERSGGSRGTPDEQREADGGVEADRPLGQRDPPVVQDNPGIVSPFEVLTNAVGSPNYSELDPTIVLFLTFPAFFGFMIGDVGYGLVYAGIGLYLYTSFESDAFRSVGVVTLAAGAMTALFGLLFGEIFGLHLITQYLWEPLLGHAPLKKGLEPAALEWANAWFVVTALVGVLHLNVAYAFEFVEDIELHGFRDALQESGSWLLALNGLWLFIFTQPPTVTRGGVTQFKGPKPDMLYQVFDTGPKAAFDLGFGGIPGLFTVNVPLLGSVPFVELVGVAMIFVAGVLLALGPAYELIEIHTTLAHPLSYLRISAELLAEVGLAFAVNLLFFGAYQSEGEFHFMLSHGSDYVLAHHENAEIMFGGLVHGSWPLVILGVLVLIVGHLIVIALGVISVGIQAIRLEYFEFFSKFYEGNGTPYEPFGRERRFTTED